MGDTFYIPINQKTYDDRSRTPKRNPLAAGAAYGPRQTLEYLYTRTWPAVRQYIKQQQGTEEDAKDVLQDAMIIFLKSSTRPARADSASRHLSYRHRENLWRQEREKRSRQIPLSPADFCPEPAPAEPAGAPADLLEFVQQLGEKCRDILVQFYYFGQRLDKIALRHGYRSIRSATVQKFKCLEQLRKKVSHLSIGNFL